MTGSAVFDRPTPLTRIAYLCDSGSMTATKTLLGAAALLLGACGAEPATPTDGVVTNRSHRAAYTTTERHCYTVGAATKYSPPPTICTSTTERHPAVWRLRILAGSGAEGWRSVPETVWDDCRIGSSFEAGRCPR